MSLSIDSSPRLRLRCTSRQGSGSGGVHAKRRAFTLIEMLIVIAIIGLLVSLLLPSLKRSMKLASETVCMHNLQQLGYALQLYRIDNEGWLPDVSTDDEGKRDDGVESEYAATPWFVRLYPSYLGDMAALTCPEDPYRFRLLGSQLPINDARIADCSSYGINGFITSCGKGYLANLDRRRPQRPLDTILAADIGPDYEGDSGEETNGGKQGPARNSSVLLWDDGYSPLAPDSTLPWVTSRHGNSINMLTIDGGVREARTDEVMQQPLRSRYDNCSAGGCTLCREFYCLPHYSFARDRLFWWTGPLPAAH